LSTIYVCTLVGVAVAILGLLVDSLWSVTRKAPWQLPRTHLTVVEGTDRRSIDLPFVGSDRRDADAAAAPPQSSRKTA